MAGVVMPILELNAATESKPMSSARTTTTFGRSLANAGVDDMKIATVAAGYGERISPDPTSARLESVDADVREQIWAQVHAKRAVAAGSVVPCKVCRPEQYLRWAGGHMDRGHDAAGCVECSGPKPRRQVPDVDRKDLA